MSFKLARKQQMQEKKKKKKKEHDSTLLTQDQLEETSYYIENGKPICNTKAVILAIFTNTVCFQD